MRSFWLDWALANLVGKWPRFLSTMWIAYIFHLLHALLSQSVLKFLHLLEAQYEQIVKTIRHIVFDCARSKWRDVVARAQHPIFRCLTLAGFPNQSLSTNYAMVKERSSLFVLRPIHLQVTDLSTGGNDWLLYVRDCVRCYLSRWINCNNRWSTWEHWSENITRKTLLIYFLSIVY